MNKAHEIYQQSPSFLEQELWQRTIFINEPFFAAEASLIEAAKEIIRIHFKENRHAIGAALRTKSGKIFTAVHLEASIGRMAVCAEAIALGMAAAVGDTDVDTTVAANRYGEILSPCGMCRELITDYAPEAKVIIEAEMLAGHTAILLIPMEKLLPIKYAHGKRIKSRWWPTNK